MTTNARLLAGLLAGGLLLLSAGTPAAAPAQLESVRVDEDQGTVMLHFAGWGPGDGPPADAFTLADPPRVVVDLPGIARPVPPEMLDRLPPGVVSVRWSLYEDDPESPVVRYVLELEQPMRIELNPEAAGLTVCARPTSAPGAATGNAGSPPADDADVNWDELARGMSDLVGGDPQIRGAASAGNGKQAGADPERVPQSPLTQAMSMPEPAAPPAAEIPPALAAPDAAPPMGESDPDWVKEDAPKMSLDVDGANIHAVLRSIAEFADVNIVADKDVQGSVVIH
ncbi:MAG: AMIN domain-containing protein, partial [Candidatus Eisenbacteria bacterium]|nr:AMIN domain-containing protein [Candidatus Eisenbacteria bacterium]